MEQMNRIGSKEGQDDFALALCGPGKYFVDLGMGDPWNGNNTVLLEQAGWRGQCFEINLGHCQHCNAARLSPAHCVDLVHESIKNILEVNNAPHVIDFISFDVDKATLPAIGKFPFEDYEFAVMCFEHDSYGNEDCEAQAAMVARLQPWPKYVRLAIDVSFEDPPGKLNPFEDWWVNTEIIDVTKLTFHFAAPWYEILQALGRP